MSKEWRVGQSDFGQTLGCFRIPPTLHQDIKCVAQVIYSVSQTKAEAEIQPHYIIDNIRKKR